MKPTGKAIVVFKSSIGFVLHLAAHPDLEFYLDDCFSLREESFPIEKCAAEYKAPEDGVFVADVSLEDDGPGDWPGSREMCVCFKSFVPISEKEWKAFVEEETVWEEPKEWEERRLQMAMEHYD